MLSLRRDPSVPVAQHTGAASTCFKSEHEFFKLKSKQESICHEIFNALFNSSDLKNDLKYLLEIHF